MGKLKVCSYAICKNEEQFVDRWYDSVSEADMVIVGDTGSTDNTILRLTKRGAIVYRIEVEPFRFDYARNKCLKLIPEDVDICVSSDLDEVISPGWRNKLEASWTEGTTRATCQFNWSHNKDNSPGITYLHQRIHKRHGYIWKYPTHEIVAYIGKNEEKTVFVEGMVYDHYPDTNKNRSFNLNLLKLAVEEEPNSSRNMHYLGREYMYLGQWEDCINTLKAYLEMPSSTWKEERAASMRFIARAYKALKDYSMSKNWLEKAIAEQPALREPYVEMSMLAQEKRDWHSMFYYAYAAINIKKKALGYSSEAFSWNYVPYDLLAISSYWLNMKENAIKYSEQAMLLEPDNARLIENHKIYTENRMK